MCISNMLLQVPLITESLSTEVAENLLEGWQSTSFPLVSLFMTAIMVKDVMYKKQRQTKDITLLTFSAGA